MGLLDSQNTEQNLMIKPDNQGTLLAIVANSIHKYFCQVIFVNLKTKFVNAMKLFNFVTTTDAPPFDTKGKTSLIVDDFAWTRNDAFLVLIFNTGALAMLPRLGSQLISVYNPTIVNVDRNDAHLYEQYNQPRGFNQLIMSKDISMRVQKLKIKQGNTSNSKYQLAMHPNMEAFMVYDHYTAFVMRLELEPELSELFDRKNTSYYFIRFCLSMTTLSKDQDILEKVPQLLTSKLPLFEFEKNEEQFTNNILNYNEGHRIQTASQINPFQMDNKVMETNQSFDAEFNEEPYVVLLNFKHLLCSFRWNPNLGLNYLEWLITVVNDCFFYFLKNSEPLYSYHCLILAEYYIKKVLHKSKTSSLLIDSETSEAIKQAYEDDVDSEGQSEKSQETQRESMLRFEDLTLKLMNPLHEIYMKGVETEEDEEPKSNQEDPNDEESTNREASGEKCLMKIKKKNQFLKGLPNQVITGNGNQMFRFQKNYLLLIYYSLIQFRNYQASNINIISLLMASFLMSKYLCSSFQESISKIQAIITKNNQNLSKTDEMDLFFGKCGANSMEEAPKPISSYRTWVKKYVIFGSAYASKFFNESNLFTLMNINHLMLAEKNSKKAVEQIDEVKDLNNILTLANNLEIGDLQQCVETIKKSSQCYIQDINKPHIRSPLQELGISLFLFANTLYYQTVSRRMRKSISTLGLLKTISELAIKLDKKSPINCISQATKIIDGGFKIGPGPFKTDEQKNSLIADLGLKGSNGFKKFTAMLFFYLGDIQRGCNLLKPSRQLPPKIDLLLFNILLLSSAFKTQIKLYETLKEPLKDFNIKTVQSLSILQQTTERLNCVHTIKYAMAEMHSTIHRIKECTKGSSQQKQVLWATFSILSFGVALPIKEQIIFDSIQNMRTIFMHSLVNEQKIMHHGNRAQQSLKYSDRSLIKPYSLALQFFKVSQLHYEHLDKVLKVPDIALQRFYQQIEIALICLWDQNNSQLLIDSVKGHQTDEEDIEKPFMEPEQGYDMLTLLYKDFQKFTKIYMFLKIKTDIIHSDLELQKLQESQQGSEKEKNVVETKKIEILVRILGSLLRLANFPKFGLVQNDARRVLGILNELLFHIKLVNAAMRENVFIPLIAQISFTKLNRQNKQLISAILEKTKKWASKNPNCGFEKVMTKLETIIFDRGQQNPKNGEEGKITDPHKIEFIKTHNEVTQWLNLQVLPEIDIKSFNKEGSKLSIQQNVDLMEIASVMQERLGLPIDSSLFFRGSCFERKTETIFGLSDELIKNFKNAKEHEIIEKEYSKQQIKPKIDQENVPGPDLQDGEPDENELDISQIDALAVSKIEKEAIEVVNLPQIRMNELVMNARQNWGFQGNTPREDLSDNLYRLGQIILDEKAEQLQKDEEKKYDGEKNQKSDKNEKPSSGIQPTTVNPLNQQQPLLNSQDYQSNPQGTSNMTQMSTSVDDRMEEKQMTEGKPLQINLGSFPKLQDANGAKISKITLRKNSARRRIAHPEQKSGARAQRFMSEKKPKQKKKGLPPKPSNFATPSKEAPAQVKPMSLTEPQPVEKEEEQSPKSSTKKVPIVVKRANEFSLVYITKPKKKEKREGSEQREQVKVKRPMKILAQKLIKQSEQSLERELENAPDTIQEPAPQKAKVKPFQLVKVRKAPQKEQEEDQNEEEQKQMAQTTPSKKVNLKKKKQPLMLFKNLSQEKKIDADKKQKMIMNLVEKLDAVKQEASKIKFDD